MSDIPVVIAENLGTGFEIDLTNRKINVVPSYQLKTQFTMLDSSLDYASTTTTVTPWGNSYAFNDNVVTYGGNHTYLATFTGRLQLSGGISLAEKSGFTSRDVISFWWELNGSVVGMYHQDNYMRDSSGSNEVSQTFPPFTIAVNEGDVIRMRHKQVAGSGGVISRQTGCDSFIEFTRVG